MLRGFLAAMLVLGVLLPGCAGKPSGFTGDDEGVEVPAGSGRLEGAVVNDAFVGVPGATVRVLGASESRKTDLDGKFVFAAMAPGSYSLRVEAPGWRSAEVDTVVEADAITKVTVFLEPELLDEPYSRVFQSHGKLDCVAVRVVSTTTEGMACTTYVKDLGFPDQWAGTVTEVTWSKGATSTPYSRVGLLSKNASDAPIYARQIADSPAKIVMRPATLHSQYQGNTPTPDKLAKGPLFVEIAKSPVQLGGADLRVGLTIQQDFELFHTVFYVETPPTIDDYSALPK